MKTIMCYGDSNTWGANPDWSGRIDIHTRWAGVLRDRLGADYHVVEEGLNGRTTVHDDPIEGSHKNGRAALPMLLETHAPLDLVIIMLGTNDLKKRFDVPASDIARGMGVLAKIVLSSTAGVGGKAPKVLLVSPARIAPLAGTPFEDMFEGAPAKSEKLAGFYAQTAAEVGCAFFDAGSVIVSSPRDAIHIEPDQHVKLGEAMVAQVKNLIG
jgi:lysophospholipase L1-like esterase